MAEKSDDAKATQEENWRLLQKLLSKSKFLAKHLSQTIARPSTENTPTQRTSRRGVQSPEQTNVCQKEPLKQPKLLTGGTMRPYQLEGFRWLNELFINGLNGILGDEMGLGKTIQVIALLAHLIDEDVPGPYLVCAPLSTLNNWIDEFKRFTPTIPVMLYHGNIDERIAMRTQFDKQQRFVDDRSCLPIIITSYEIVLKDEEFLRNFNWTYLIIDEGHRMKNLCCKLFSSLVSLTSANRLLLTGTPLQNSLSELWALLHFLMPDLFNRLSAFNSWFDASSMSDEGSYERIVKQEQEKHILAAFHQIVSPFMLRRVKADVAVFIPPKQEFIIKAPLMPRQEELYKAILNKTIFQQKSGSRDVKDVGTVHIASENSLKTVCVTEEDGIVTKGRNRKRSATVEMPVAKKDKLESVYEVNLKTGNILSALRKACNHPYQIEYPLDVQTNDYKVDEDIVNRSGKMIVLDILLNLLKQNGHKVLIFSQMTSMLDIIQDFCYFRSYKYCRLDGRVKMKERQEQIESFYSDDDCSIFLISTRAGGLGINLVAADAVIIYDSDWNPQCDLQAMARCHRIGQTKRVVVLRLITESSIEEEMVNKAAAKRKLEKMVMSTDLLKKGSEENHSVDPQQLLDLLASSDHAGIIFSNNDRRLMTEELDKLLRRSFSDTHSDGDSVAATDKNSNRVTVITED